MTKKQKLELTWIGKENRPKLEPRILLEDLSVSYHADLGSIPAGPTGEPSTLAHNLEARKLDLLRDINQRNRGDFEQEVQKVDAWADDLKLGLEQEIKEVRRSAAISPTLEEKLSWQKKQRDLEAKRSKLRRELFAPQDEIEAQRNDLITQLEAQLQQRVDERTLFTVEWELK